jgi:hypothetical protein
VVRHNHSRVVVVGSSYFATKEGERDGESNNTVAVVTYFVRLAKVQTFKKFQCELKKKSSSMLKMMVK